MAGQWAVSTVGIDCCSAVGCVDCDRLLLDRRLWLGCGRLSSWWSVCAGSVARRHSSDHTAGPALGALGGWSRAGWLVPRWVRWVRWSRAGCAGPALGALGALVPRWVRWVRAGCAGCAGAALGSLAPGGGTHSVH